jgi:hypothetical protein
LFALTSPKLELSLEFVLEPDWDLWVFGLPVGLSNIPLEDISDAEELPPPVPGASTLKLEI